MRITNVTPEIVTASHALPYVEAEIVLTAHEIGRICDAMDYRGSYEDDDLKHSLRNVGNYLVENECDRMLSSGMLDHFMGQKITMIKHLRLIVPAAGLKQAKEACERRMVLMNYGW